VHSQELEALVSDGWETALLEEEQSWYVEEGLLDILGMAAINNESQSIT
jgi:hypothetical protein